MKNNEQPPNKILGVRWCAEIRKMKLTDDVFRSFRVAKVFRENSDRINCLNFSANGESMIASSNDDSIAVYCCLEGKWVLIRITLSPSHFDVVSGFM